MSIEDLERLQGVVLADPEQVTRLVRQTDLAEFVAALVALAASHDLEVTPEDVAQAMNESDRRWIERWV